VQQSPQLEEAVEEFQVKRQEQEDRVVEAISTTLERLETLEHIHQ
jgi:hypothetical protein